LLVVVVVVVVAAVVVADGSRCRESAHVTDLFGLDGRCWHSCSARLRRGRLGMVRLLKWQKL
jgi:hypothetical protein